MKKVDEFFSLTRFTFLIFKVVFNIETISMHEGFLNNFYAMNFLYPNVAFITKGTKNMQVLSSNICIRFSMLWIQKPIFPVLLFRFKISYETDK